jgi:hypothetical protein
VTRRRRRAPRALTLDRTRRPAMSDPGHEEAAAEMRSLRDAVSRHPFPPYHAIETRTRTVAAASPEFSYLLAFSANEHDSAERIYNSAFDKEVCTALGMSISKAGGIDAMRRVYYAAVELSDLGQASAEDRAMGGLLLSMAWHGTDSWQH